MLGRALGGKRLKDFEKAKGKVKISPMDEARCMKTKEISKLKTYQKASDHPEENKGAMKTRRKKKLILRGAKEKNHSFNVLR